MTLLIKRTNCQVTAFIFATIGWFLSTTAMGLAEWRLWHMDRQASNIDPNLACVGMWRVCLYYHSSKKDIFCHRFSYGETLLPLDIRVSQNLLLVTTILGLCGKASITLAIKSVYLGLLHRAATCSPFVVSGVLYLIASSCTAVTVAWNFFSVLNEQRFDFPRSVSLPFQPDTQEVGTASLMAALGSLLMLASGLIFLSFKVPQDSQLHA
ncbi:claudin-34 [Tenrec ecaudatus]|uniref:claudin-34 n=1 Tax=Tenrec ecaudatus TaxID=94439 RepID=UPI003F591204